MKRVNFIVLKDFGLSLKLYQILRKSSLDTDVKKSPLLVTTVS